METYLASLALILSEHPINVRYADEETYQTRIDARALKCKVLEIDTLNDQFYITIERSYLCY